MNSSLYDPNNHVPEVSPEDSWGDPEEVTLEKTPAPMVLPARRTLVDQPRAVGPVEVGLRIGSNPARAETVDTPTRLEVQEINGAVIRLDPATDTPPRIERQFTFHEKPAREKSAKDPHGEGRDWGLGKLHATHWIFGMAVTVGLVVVSSLMMLPAINAPNTPRTTSLKGTLSVVDEDKVEGMEATNLLLTKQPEALQIFRSYLRASSVDELIPLVKDGRILEETLRNHWHPSVIPMTWTPGADTSWSVIDLDGRAYGLLEGQLPDKSTYTAYLTDQDGRLLLDWKPTVAFGTASFTQLNEGTGDGAEIRGEVSMADFYNANWPEADYQSYRLTSPGQEITIWCYARRSDAPQAQIAPLFSQGEIIKESRTSRKITLCLVRGPEGAQPNQWLIREMLHIDWATP